jgi:hypothetical protein
MSVDKMMKKDGELKWYVRPVPVIVLLFFILGPFALPLLYKSPKFSKSVKVGLSIIVIAYTFYLSLAVYLLGRELYSLMGLLKTI